ncbi:MAG: DUF4349 domain-containing protein [Candidatus Methanoperedens sp.]
MNNKALVLIAMMFLIIISGCIGTQKYSQTDNSLGAKSIDYNLMDQSSRGETNIPGVSERKVISTATLTIEVVSAQAAINDITNITLNSGGFISSSSINDIGSSRRSGFITARVPQDKFYPAIEKIESLGTRKQRQISGQDVTEEFIDLGARLDNFKKQEARLLDILKMAATVKDIIEVEHELERVRGEIESLTGRLNYLNQSVEMSTITVNVMEPSPIAGEDWGISDTLGEAARGFIDSIKGLIIFTGFIIPILIYAGIMIVVVLGVKRKILPKLKG